LIKLLAALPFVGMFVGIIWFNQTTPLICGLPMALAWLVLCTILSTVVLGLIYLIDPINRADRPS
jgi:hypothetical protein